MAEGVADGTAGAGGKTATSLRRHQRGTEGAALSGNAQHERDLRTERSASLAHSPIESDCEYRLSSVRPVLICNLLSAGHLQPRAGGRSIRRTHRAAS